MEALFTAENLIGLLTLTIMEIVLGIDNIVFISILASKLPAEQQNRARQLGLAIAMFARIALLLTVSVIASLTEPLITIAEFSISGRDLILIGGGLFLIYKATREIHHKLEGESGEISEAVAPSFQSVIIQILLLDLVFSLDSVITAVGMVNHVEIMIVAVIIAVGVMLIAAKPLSDFVNRHPTVKMLALSFLLLIGLTLLVDGLHQHIPKEYVYFAMGFSVFVEFLNLRASSRKKHEAPVQLKQPYVFTETPKTNH